MRYKLLGDLLLIKSAVVYERGYVDTEKRRQAIGQLNVIKVKDSDYSSFMEYNFKFDIDKKNFPTSNIYESLGKSTLSSLNFSEDSDNIPIDQIIFQYHESDESRRYSFFEMHTLDNYTNILMNVPIKIQKVEFYDRFLDKELDENGNVIGIYEYNENSDEENEIGTPILILEFGPEESYEPEDYYNKEDMPIKPDWEEDDEINYQKSLDEYYNNKFIIISTTSSDSSSLNISLLNHENSIVPHRNQSKYVLSNKDFKLIRNNVGNTIATDNYTSLSLDCRSNTILGTEKVDKSSMTILNDLLDRSLNKEKVFIEDSNEYKEFNSYKDYIVYNRKDRVAYNGKVYESLINGNLYENPSISPMWSYIQDINDPIDPPIKVCRVNVRVNDESLGTVNPIGMTEVIYGYDLIIEIISEIAEVKSVYIDMELTDVHISENKFHIQSVKDDHDVFIEFYPIYKNINISISPENGGTVTGNGEYIVNSEVTLTASPNYGYEFLSWVDTKSGNVLGENEELIIPKLYDNLDLLCNFKIKSYKVEITCNEGGSFSHKFGTSGTIYIDHGDSLCINIIPKSGYELEYIEINSEVTNRYSYINKLCIDNIEKEYKINIYYSRPRYHVIDPILGRINYFIVGDQLWCNDYLSYKTDSIGEDKNGIIYYSDNDVKEITDILNSGGTSFRIPRKSDIEYLYETYDKNLVGKKFKSSSITKFDKNGWINSIYIGLGEYKVDFMPYGYLLFDKLIGINEESCNWCSSIDENSKSRYFYSFFYNSPISEISLSKFKDVKMSIKLMGDTPKNNILGDNYRILEINVIVDVIEDDKINKYKFSQKWMIDNLNYDKLGVLYENSDNDKFGRLYGFEDMKSISSLLTESGSEFKVPTNLDYIILEKFLGYNKDKISRMDGEFIIDLDTYQTGYVGTIEGKRLKTGNLIYSGINWNGYDNNDLENSQLNIYPSGYGIKYDDNSIDFLGIGTDAKFWTSSSSLDDDTLVYSRSINFSEDRIFRGVEYGDRSLMSIRLVNTKYELIES